MPRAGPYGLGMAEDMTTIETQEVPGALDDDTRTRVHYAPGARSSPSDRSVLQRAASLLQAFSDGEPVLTLNELVDRSGLPKSTVYRLAEQLISLGWLEKDVFGYKIGLYLFEVGGLAERYRKLRDRALPYLQQLSYRTGLPVQFGVLKGRDVVYLERVLVREFPLPTRSGGRMPAHCTALGKALLAFSAEKELQPVLAGPLEPRTPSTVTSHDQLLHELSHIRSSNFAREAEECYLGISCAAVPVRGSGNAIAAISVSGPPQSVKPSDLTPLLRAAAAGVWNDLLKPRSSDEGGRVSVP